MTVYLVILEDRHADVQVWVYSDKGDALEHAEEIVEEYGHEPDEPDEPVEGWLFNATLSGEGDYVRVEEKVVNDGLAE